MPETKRITIEALRTVDDWEKCREENPQRYDIELAKVKADADKGDRARLNLYINIIQAQLNSLKTGVTYGYFGRGKRQYPVVRVQAPDMRPFSFGLSKAKALKHVFDNGETLDNVINILSNPDDNKELFTFDSSGDNEI